MKSQATSEIKWDDLVQLNRHQVFTGAVNPGDHCFSVGYLNTTSFIVYGSGTNLVILTCNLDTLQIIPGIKYGNIQVGCVECSSSEGMIAASYAHHIYLFKPKSLDGQVSVASINDPGNVKWHEIGFFQLESFVTSLSWNPDGSQLLTAAAERIQLWKASLVDTQADWFCAWQYKSPNPISNVKFSPNGHYFATVGKEDSFVKIWYKQLYQLPSEVDNPSSESSAAQQMSINSEQSDKSSTAIYNYVYIAHPCAVTGFSWRTTSHLMPKNAVLSYILTSCRDNKCRIWSETSDSLRRHHVSLTLSCNVADSSSPTFHTQDVKSKYQSDYFTAAEQTSPSRLLNVNSADKTTTGGERIEDDCGESKSTNMDESFFHVDNRQQVDMAYGNPSRFHLVSVINPQTDIPSSVGTVLNGEVPDSTQFAVHWLNNKAFHFNLQAEIIFRYLHKKFKQQQIQSQDASTPTRRSSTSGEEDLSSSGIPKGSQNGVEEKPSEILESGKSLIRIAITLFDDLLEFDWEGDEKNERQRNQSLKMEPLAVEGFSEVLKKSLPHWLKEWQSSYDMVFSIHPIDGSLLLWKIDSLDEHTAGSYRHPQISFASRIPNAFPASDAISCSNNLLMYRAALCQDIEKFLKLKFEHQMSNPFILTNQNFANGLFAPNVVIFSKHSDGSLNQWEVSFDANSKYSSLQTVSHLCRVSGHRFHMVDLKNHPSLPLLITTSHHNVPKMVITDSYQNGKKSETVQQFARKGKKLMPQMSLMESHLEQSVMQNSDVITEDLSAPHGLCSELILWRVDPVGPLSQSGGLLELARVQSPSISAFCATSWIPTLLPSHVLGPVSRSPSVSFVAFDGKSLRVYQSIIDAQPLLTKLAVLKGSPVKSRRVSKPSNLNVVSQQSTNQPACIIELDQLESSDFLKNYVVKLFHVFKYEGFVSHGSSRKSSSGERNSVAFNEFNFDEKFVLVAIAKSPDETAENNEWCFFTWTIRIFISDPQPFDPPLADKAKQVPDYNDDLMLSPKSRSSMLTNPIQNQLRVSSTFEGCQELGIEGANVESASVAELGPVSKVVSSTGEINHHLKENLYQVVTALDDKRVVFWNCQRKSGNFSWRQWRHPFSKSQDSCMNVHSVPVSVTCANFGRLALAYKISDPSSDLISIKVEVFENESSGGSTWVVEDTVETPKSKSPNMVYGASVADLQAGTSRSVIASNTLYKDGNENNLPQNFKPKQETLGRISSFYRKTKSPRQMKSDHDRFGLEHKSDSVSRKTGDSKIQKVYLDLHETEKREREFVHIAWVPKYDGSYLLCICTGDRVIVYSSFTTTQTNPSNVVSKTPVCKKFSRTWVPIAFVKISTSDELSPFPVLMSSVSNGILILGLMNEMQIFSQWTSKNPINEEHEFLNSDETDHSVVSKMSQHSSKSMLSETKRLKGSIQSANASIKGSLSSLSLSSYLSENKKKADEPDGKEVEGEAENKLMSAIDPGIFEKSRALNPVLPQYHPKLLIGLLNFGKIPRVKAILAHLVKTLVGEEAVAKAVICGDLEENEKTDAIRTRRATLNRSMTIHNGGSTSGGGLWLDINLTSNIESVPPLPLYTLIEMDALRSTTATNPVLSADKNRTRNTNDQVDNIMMNGNAHSDKYDALFGSPDVGKGIDTLLEVDLDFSVETEGQHKQQALPSPNPEAVAAALSSIGPTYFGPAQSRLLSQCLARLQLPDLSRVDQMHLLAVAQVVSSMSTDSSNLAQGSDSTMTTDTIDDCGMRFVMGLKLHQFIMKGSGQSLLSSPLDPGLFAWAHLSESEDQMISHLRPNSKWVELRNIGVGWWVTNLNTLRRLIERVAREHFQAKKDPMDSAIFYIAMQKKNVLRGLFKSVGDEKMTNFFSKDFTTDENKRVALKNAFALNSKQRFEHAAAFFLLAGQLEDAVQVCIRKLEDIQLAIVISRLFEEELEFSSCAKRILKEHVINSDSGIVQNPEFKNPFLKCISHWWLREFSSALCALVESCTSDSGQNISVFNFYNYLRKHPMIVRRHILKIEQINDRSIAGQSVLLTQMTGVQDTKGEKTTSLIEVSSDERLLFFKTATDHFTNGCPLLALEVLTILPPVRKDDLDLNSSLDVHQINKKRDMLRSGTIDKPAEDPKVERAEDFDWGFGGGAGGTNKSATESGMLDWGAPVALNNGFDNLDLNLDLDLDDVLKVECEDLDEPQGDGNKTEAVFEAEQKVHPENVEQHRNEDLFSIYLKQEACLKIFVEELRTLAMAIDCDESHLRAYFRVWLEKIGALLDVLCNQKSELQIDNSDDEFLEASTMEDCLSPVEQTSYLFQLDVEKKLAKAILRKAWLRHNESLLNLLLGYSSLYGCNGGGLSCVRMELILLLQELQQNYSKKQILSPLPFPNSLPLISACLAPIQTVVVNPFNSLEKFCQDLVKTLTSYTTPPQSQASLKIAITLRNLCGALSSCIYQSLQDSNKVSMSTIKKSNPNSPSPVSPLQNGHAANGQSSKVGELYTRNYSEDHTTSVLVSSKRHQTETNMMSSSIISKPSAWPGVKLFIRLLSDYAHLRNSGSESRLRILLVESCCIVYTGILFHALVMNDANELLRVIANPISTQMFALVAGGCVRTRSQTSNVMLPPHDAANLMKNSSASRKESAANLAANKHRISLNSKVLGQSSGSIRSEEKGGPPSPVVTNEENKYQYEKFSSPVMTVFDYILSKPSLPSTMDFIHYESDDEAEIGLGQTLENGFHSDDDSNDEDDGYGFRSSTGAKDREQQLFNEHSDPNSYSWCIMRFAIITSVLDTINSFILEMGLELSELALHSPTLQNLRNTLTQWQNVAHTQLSLMASNGPPENFIPVVGRTATEGSGLTLGESDYYSNSSLTSGGNVRPGRPTANDLFHPDATPFKSNSVAVLPVKRLWCYLVRQKRLENLFFHYCFTRPGGEHGIHGNNQLTIPSRHQTRAPDGTLRPWDQFEIPVNPVAVVYRDVSNETINALCFNNIPLTLSHSIHCLVVATQKDITENDITNIVCPPAPSSGSTLAMLGKNKSGHTYSSSADYEQPVTSYSNVGLFSHRKGNSLKRSYATNVRKLTSHPFLPFYLSGCSYGKLNLWEWGHEDVVAMFKTSNSKITGLNFNADGKKLGVCDESGNLHLYHTSYGGLQQTFQKPFMSLECHGKQCAGFCFVGCSSLVATVGTGLGTNSLSHLGAMGSMPAICMWDCLMPTNRHKNLIAVHQGNASDTFCSVTYSASTRSVVAGTAKGEVLLYDTRQRMIQATLPAFTQTQAQVKCLALDPLGNLLAVGSRDGDIKVFDLSSSKVVFHSEGEHKRKDGLFKTGPRGVLDLQILSSGDHLLSCGSDGAVKLRKLTNCATPITQYLL